MTSQEIIQEIKEINHQLNLPQSYGSWASLFERRSELKYLLTKVN